MRFIDRGAILTHYQQWKPGELRSPPKIRTCVHKHIQPPPQPPSPARISLVPFILLLSFAFTFNALPVVSNLTVRFVTLIGTVNVCPCHHRNIRGIALRHTAHAQASTEVHSQTSVVVIFGSVIERSESWPSADGGSRHWIRTAVGTLLQTSLT